MKKPSIILILVALGIVAAVAAVGVTRAGAMTTHHRGATAATGGSAGCQRLMQDPKAMQVMHTLHADHQKDIQAWRDKYGANPSSPEAQQALTQLWREHNQEMRAAFEKAGIKVPAGVCTRKMMSAAVTGNGGMMGAGGTDMMGTGGAGSQSLHEQHHSGQASGMMDGGSGMMGGTY